MDRWDRAGAQLALLADEDRDTARQARPWLLSNGFELVHARAGVAALELLQRMPQNFGLVLVDLNLPDIPGVVLIETLRHFRPNLPVICLTVPQQEVDFDVAACLSKPINRMEFNTQLSRALGSAATPINLLSLDGDVIARAKARYAVSGDLMEAARELSRGHTGGAGGTDQDD